MRIWELFSFKETLLWEFEDALKQCCGTGTARTAIFSLCGTGTGSEFGTRFGSGSNIKWITKVNKLGLISGKQFCFLPWKGKILSKFCCCWKTVKYCLNSEPDPKPEQKLSRSRNRNRDKSLRFHNTALRSYVVEAMRGREMKNTSRNKFTVARHFPSVFKNFRFLVGYFEFVVIRWISR